ncbi:MAG: diphthamide biosynthesis enzyme Dph2 [archaeon]
MYDFKLDKINEEIKEKGYQKVLLQLPEGLKPKAYDIVNSLEAEVFVSGEPCWGACDLAINDAKELKVDAIIIFGHAPFIKTDIPIIYAETPYLKDIPNDLLIKLKEKLQPYNKIGLAASIQHVHQLQNLQLNKPTLIAPQSGRNICEGQVLGCDCSGTKQIQREVDVILVIGTRFHALGVALNTSNPVILLDLYNEEILNMEEDKNKMLQKRYAQIEKAKEAKKFAILISLKPGQKEMQLAKQLQIKNSITISITEITPEKLIQFYDIDCFISLACPRLVVEESARFTKPLLNYKEYLVLTNQLEWNDILKSGLY